MSARACGVLLALLAPLPAAAASYTFDQFTERVANVAPSVEAVRGTEDLWRGKLGEAQRNWAPTGSVGATLGGSPRILCADVNGYVNPDQGTRSANCVRTQTVDLLRNYGHLLDASPFAGLSMSFNMSLIQPFTTFGKIETAIRAARAQSERFKAEVEGARADARHRAAEVWWKYKWARAALAVSEYEVSRVAQWVARIEDTKPVKGRPVFGERERITNLLALDIVQQRRADLEKSLLQAEAQVRVMAHDPEATIDDSELELEPFDEQSLEFYEDAMRHLRSEPKQIANGMEASRMWVRYRLTEMLPDIGLVSGFSYGYSTSANDVAAIPGTQRWTYGPGGYFALGARAPLDFANRHAIWKLAAAEHRSNLARRDYWMGGMSLEVEKALSDLREARARESRTRHAEKIARGWLVVSAANTGTGLAVDGRELIEVTRAYSDWRLQHLRAIHDANLQASWLRRTTGLAKLVAPPK